MYSPECALFAKEHKSTEKVADSAEWAKYQGELNFGSDQAFHNGAAAVLGVEVTDVVPLAAIMREVVQQGKIDDKYNLWYCQFCKAVEQQNYDESGVLRTCDNGNGAPTAKPKLEQGHEGKSLADFTHDINVKLEDIGSDNRVTDALVLALRLYTTSSFKRFNAALRDSGLGRTTGELGFKACVQSARTCVLHMQAIRRPKAATFRGVTGYLGNEFESNAMGMDFASFSATAMEGVATDFTGSVACSVLFEIEYLRGCPGVDVSVLSVFPGEKEVLFPPCTGLSLVGMADEGLSARTGAGAGQVRVRVSPSAAH